MLSFNGLRKSIKKKQLIEKLQNFARLQLFGMCINMCPIIAVHINSWAHQYVPHNNKLLCNISSKTPLPLLQFVSLHQTLTHLLSVT